jgi:hypothetical protein
MQTTDIIPGVITMQTSNAYAEIVDLVPYLRMISRERKEPDRGVDLLGTLKKEFGLVEVEG